MANITYSINLLIESLLDDVHGKMHYFARSHAQSDTQEALLQAINEDGNEDMVMRSFNNAIGEGLKTIGRYATLSVDESSNDTISPTANIMLTLTLPSNYKKGSGFAVTQAMHRLLVDTAYADWVKVVSPSEGQTALADVMADMEAIKAVLSERVRPDNGGKSSAANPFQTTT